MRTRLLFIALLGVLACSSQKSPARGDHPGSASPAVPTVGTMAPSPDAGSLTPSDEALLDEVRGFADRLKRELTETIGVIETAHGDCAKAAAGMVALAPARQETISKGTDLMARVHGRAELKAQVRTIMDSAFPQDVRDRADAVIDPMQSKCADNPAFQDAMQKTGYPKKKNGP